MPDFAPEKDIAMNPQEPLVGKREVGDGKVAS